MINKNATATRTTQRLFLLLACLQVEGLVGRGGIYTESETKCKGMAVILRPYEISMYVQGVNIFICLMVHHVILPYRFQEDYSCTVYGKSL